MDWSIQFYYDKNLNAVFIHKFFYFLISRGVKYSSKYEGSYWIRQMITEKVVEYHENEIKESTEKLAEIIDTYLTFDLNNTLFRVFLDYYSEGEAHFFLAISPYADNKYLIKFEVIDGPVPGQMPFLSLVNLCKEVFARFDFVCGAVKIENEDIIPMDADTFLKDPVNTLSYYSKPLVEKIGREKLLSAPAKKIEELENGGVMLLICYNPLGCSDTFDVRHHLE